MAPKRSSEPTCPGKQEKQEHPFTAVSIDPGVIDTDMQALIRGAALEDFPEVSRFAKRKETGGLAAPDAVASGIIRLVVSSELKTGARYEVLGNA